ncbi:probable E3 ubiquitin-protein ligase RHC1A [Malania oleifera]|uniref:probable E3 ubiquitin-protein ligase RHC1A n=1 Tax=Malania oleifera TaxID=397392 RepID=UPI0025ADBF51|nr:probable E3 ubiquitin-protein ligase RHC1A [Malania oleifera]
MGDSILPSSFPSIDALPTIKITQTHLLSEKDSQCPICIERFLLGTEAKQTPCNHIYHSSCIDDWLARRSSCPVCRQEFSPRDSGARSGVFGVGGSGRESSGPNQGRSGDAPASVFRFPLGSSGTYEQSPGMGLSGWPFDY